MVNIFRDIEKLSTNDIRMELALMKNINLTNAAKETGSRMVGAIAKMATSLMQSVSENSSIDYDATGMADVIRSDYDELAGVDRNELIRRLCALLTQKCAAVGGTGLSEERITYIVISEAARFYNLPKYTTFTNKLNDIIIYYYKDFIQALHEMLKHQTGQAADELDKRLQKRLDIISLEAKRELSSKLYPKEFSGRGIAKVLRLEKQTKYLETAVNIMGVECFDHVAVYAYNSQRTLKNLSQMGRYVYAQLIWRVYGHDKDNIPHTDETQLPSYVKPDMAAQAHETESEFRSLLKSRIDSDKEIENLKKAVEKNEAAQVTLGDKVTSLQAEYDDVSAEFEQLEKDKDIYMSGSRPEPDTKKYYSRVNSVKRQQDNIRTALETARDRYQASVTEGDNLKELVKSREYDCRRLHDESNRRLGEATRSLKLRWEKYYSSVVFDEKIFGQVVLSFTREELLMIEEFLADFMSLDDKSAIDYEKGVIYCGLHNGTAKIYHEDSTVTDIKR